MGIDPLDDTCSLRVGGGKYPIIDIPPIYWAQFFIEYLSIFPLYARSARHELVSLYQAAGIRDFEELACHGDSSIIQVEVEKSVDENRLDALEYVEEWEHVTTLADSHLYVIAFYAPELSDEITDQVAELMGTCEPEISDAGVTMSLVGSQEAISGTLSEYENDGITPNLRKLGEYEGRTQPLDKLTDRQREVIQTAFDMGYYEIPRNVSIEEIAAELDIDSSTVAEHLQRAERNLLTPHLSSD